MTGPGQVDIQNELNVTVLFPDSNGVQPTNGLFESQEEFRKFMFENDLQRMKATFYTKPTANRQKDYVDDEFVKAFPLQFPYGYGGFPREQAYKEFYASRKRKVEFAQQYRHFLRNGKKTFHEPSFNLVGNAILMRHSVFEKVRLQCNLRYCDLTAMGEKFGEMSSSSLHESVLKARRLPKNTFSSNATDKFLDSITAVSRGLPHSNEATTEARSHYFSLLAKFGLPALMVTISPDDRCSLWIQLALLKDPTKLWSGCTVDKMPEKDLDILYRERASDRIKYPGLCAENYIAIIDTFIAEILRWDDSKQESFGVGLFGEVEAYAVVSEEQGRKTPHGHFLLWIRGWNKLLHRIMSKKGTPHQRRIDLQLLRDYVEHSLSARTFREFSENRELSSTKIYKHEGCRRTQTKPVSTRMFAEMRHASLCRTHAGHFGTCSNESCGNEFKFDAFMEDSINRAMSSENYRYDQKKRRLETYNYAMQQDRFWYDKEEKEQARRLFLSNAMYNSHSVTHTKRCFKRAKICYAGFPAEPVPKTQIRFAETPVVWTDFDGRKEYKYIFEVKPERGLEDCYTNAHNRLLTSLFLCNNNVIAAMTGAAVMYVTGYNVKHTQKEEREAFEKVASVLIQLIEDQQRDSDATEGMPKAHVGFRRLMLAVMLHTSSYVIAAPLAHYLALNGSRYRYSHRFQYFPLSTLSKLLRNEPIRMHFTPFGKTDRVPFCTAMHYTLRPNEPFIEDMSSLTFFTSIAVVERKEAKSQKIPETEQYEFIDKHPKRNKFVCVRRRIPRIPNIDWSFFGDARLLSTTIDKIKRPTDFDQQYCRKILLCTTPFRSEEDLLVNGSYVYKLNRMIESGELQEDHREILQNIQNIRNSLDSGRMQSNISDDIVDPDEDIAEDNEATDSEQLRNLIAQTFHNPSFQRLNTEPTIFQSKEDLVLDGKIEETIETEQELFSVIDTEPKPQPTQDAASKHTNRFKAHTSVLNQLIKKSFRNDNQNTSTNEIECNGTAESIMRYGVFKKLDLEQQHTFEILAATVVLSFFEDSLNSATSQEEREAIEENIQDLKDLSQEKTRNGHALRLFVTGPAGAGKSTLLEALLEYVQKFCLNIGHVFDSGVIRLTALTGSAATEIKGQTTHRECKVNKRAKISEDDIREWFNTRLLVIDEISFAGYENFLIELSKKLQLLTEDTKTLYGRIPIVFIGDFQQLEPINSSDVIYKRQDSYYWEQALNLMIELKGKHRFKDCPHLQRAFSVIREQGITPEIRKMFNSRVVGAKNSGSTVKMPDIRKVKTATYSNKTKMKFNNAVFMDHLRRHHSQDESDKIPECTVIIKGKAKWKHNNQDMTFSERQTFFESANESNTKSGNKRVDPFLKLFSKCELMYGHNDDVYNGVANGSTALLEKVVLHEGRKPHKIRYNGYYVFAVNAEDVKYMQLQWTKDSAFSGSFTVAPKTLTCRSTMNVRIDNKEEKNDIVVTILQFGVLNNHATTGHKLQGKSVDSLLVGEYNTTLPNWIYVVLSRVRKLKDLYLLKKLPEDISSTPNQQMTDMMERLRKRILWKQDIGKIQEMRQRIPVYQSE